MLSDWRIILGLVGLLALKTSCHSKSPPASQLSNVELVCPDEWIQHGSKCYKQFNIQQSWPFALATCQRYGSNLAMIKTTSQNQFIANLLAKPTKAANFKDIWIGLTVEVAPTDEQFIWSDGAPTSRYNGFWRHDQPNFHNGTCTLATVNHKELEWRLDTCNLLRKFVCERPACVRGSYFCSSGSCISEKNKCNGVRDCDDGSDELNCPTAFQPPCHTMEKGESGQISSPNYPNPYDPNLSCRHVLETVIGSRIEITIEHMETEPDFDTLTILEGGPAENSTRVLARLSGTQSTQTFHASSNIVIIQFHTDAQSNFRGWSLKWRAVPFTCGGRHVAQAYQQSFTSTGYPMSLPRGAECVWILETTPGQVISLTIDDMDLSEEDQVIFYDGPSPSAEVLGVPKHLTSSQNFMYIYLMTSATSSVRRGFSISYKRGCDLILSEQSGTITSPGNLANRYPNNIQCTYTIESADDARSISVIFDKFDVAEDDSLKVLEKNRNLLTDDNSKPDHQINSESSRLQVTFASTATRQAMGYNFTWSIDCAPLKPTPMVSLSTKDRTVNTVVVASCPVGFEFADGEGVSKQMTCLLGGKWSNDEIATCQPIYCGPVPQIANGYASQATNVSYGGQTKYTCYKGFYFASGKDTETAYCAEDAKWTTPPQCKASTCQPLPQFTNGNRKLEFGDGTGYGSVFRFDCHSGYRREGVESLLCKSDGQWSSLQQPTCVKVMCTNLPRVANAKIETPPERFAFGDVARVVCHAGFVLDGPEEIRCLANQTVSATPVCEDVDECATGVSQCQSLGTRCHNLPGSYMCQCLTGYQPQLMCLEASQIIVNAKGQPDSILTPITPSSSVSWCLSQTSKAVSLKFDIPMIVEKIKLSDSLKGSIKSVSIKYSTSHTTRSKKLVIDNQQIFQVDQDGIIDLPVTIEAETLEIHASDIDGMPCLQIEALGCQRTACADVNECLRDNGKCDHTCLNTQGGYKCECRNGYDLDLSNNRTCVPRECGQVSSPDNGKLLSTAKTFEYPIVVQFQCDFGYQMMGPDFIKCLADGTWNGTEPYCLPATCQGLPPQVGLVASPNNLTIAFGENVTLECTDPERPGKRLRPYRQCIFDPQDDGRDYWLTGPQAECDYTECPAPPVMPGAVYVAMGDEDDERKVVGSKMEFTCRKPYTVVGRSDRTIKCLSDSTWDLGDLRCEGPVCADPGFPNDGQIDLNSVEEGAIARFSCNRPGYTPFPSESLQCTLGAACVLSEDVGITSGFVPDGAFADNSDSTMSGYEPHKSRMSSTGWCGAKDAFIFLSVDLQRVYTLTTLRIAGVAGTGFLKGHVTKLQLFYKTQFSKNYDTYPVEFETPAGNHNAMHHFDLKPPLRARYILLGVYEYEGHPCMKFDLQGCLAPATTNIGESKELIGWNGPVPECVDMQPPEFEKCPDEVIFVKTDENGQLKAVEYDEPVAKDNSGKISYTQVEPSGMRPGLVITADTDVTYTAFDSAGNTAVCVVRIRIPDTQAPVLKCPDSYTIPVTNSTISLEFNISTVDLVVHDTSNITTITFNPPSKTLKIGEFVEVTTSVEDENGNRNSCKFQVVYSPELCSPASLTTSNHVIKECRHDDGAVICGISCAAGYRFVDPAQTTQNYVCNTKDGKWSPRNNAPACVAIPEQPAGFHMNVGIDYPIVSAVPDHCLKGYAELAAKSFDDLDKVLSERCSSSVEVYVRLLKLDFNNQPGHLSGNYTIQILPTVLQSVFYDLCGLTLRTIFDLRIPGATGPIKSLLTLSGDAISSQSVGCPTIQATVSKVSQGFACANGDVLRQEHKDKLPECMSCPIGSVNINNTCVLCSRGSYQDDTGQITCKACPAGTYTLDEGALSISSCLSTCAFGTYSTTGLIPCQLCPRHTYAGLAPVGGFKECTACPSGAYTSKLGASSAGECRLACKAGSFSNSGLEPCSACPINFYQPNAGQQSCVECSNSTATQGIGETAETGCLAIDCNAKLCENGAECSVFMHKAQCHCKPGYSGDRCEEIEDLCSTKPCYNNGKCEQIGTSYRCICPKDFTGARCQFETDDCIGVVCPNGGVCHDLPGHGTRTCLCRTGFAGAQCEEVTDICSTANPCKNGARCIGEKLGRFKCQCVPGWDGPTCDHNIDDCADSPCALNSTCIDLVNDFKCQCPSGFSGKRCQIKDDLCTSSPCQNGICIDKLFSRECICEPGWEGTNCETNIDECTKLSPCKNDAKCIDEVNGYKCECADGYQGTNCENLVDHCGGSQVSPCHNNATCTNMGPTYHCDCALGFDGVHCEMNIDECSPESSECDKLGTESCRDGVNSYTCVCKPGYTGTFCETKINQCADSPCLNDGQCVDMGGAFKCNCKPGWTGARCEQDNGSCASKPCRNDGYCVSLIGDYFCVCPAGVSGKNCETAPNRCIGEPCHNGGVCGDFGSHLECSCPPGFSGKGCEFKNVGCDASSCQNGGKCVNIPKSGYAKSCQCAPGFTGDHCETNIDECATAHCPAGASCLDQVNGHICQCPFNLTGTNCDKTINTNYDLQFLDPFRAASAQLYAPFRIESDALSVSVWVRFDKPYQHALFFSLHEFGNSSNSLLDISSNLIKISLFNTTASIELPLSTSHQLNTNAKWNHLLVTWSAKSGAYSLIWNSLRIYTNDGYAIGQHLDIQAGITLGAREGESPFVGALTRVNVWNRVIDFEEELPQMVQHCQRSDEMFKGLLVRFEGYSKIRGRIERTHRSTCGLEIQKARQSHPIIVEECPTDMIITSQSRETNITWEEPIFIGVNDVIKVEKNLKQGQMLTWGEYNVVYIATDNQTNQAECSFKVRVGRENCEELSDPVNGLQSCENWGPQLKYKACSIECRDGFDFPREPAVFYTCGEDGMWRPKQKATVFKYPQCTKHVPATKVVVVRVGYSSSPACTDSSKEAFILKVEQTINEIDNRWKMCSLADASGCVGTQVRISCDGKGLDMKQHRHRRRRSSTPFEIEIEIPVKRKVLHDPTTNREISVRDALHTEILNGILNFEKIMPNARPDLSTLEILEEYNCQAGQIVSKDLCVPCSPGTYHSNVTGKCELCEVGEYQPLTARTECFKCAHGQITESEGAQSEQECKDNCPPGHQYDAASAGCVKCGFGYYQSMGGSFTCHPCGHGKTTLSDTAVSEDECRDECPDGEQLSSSGMCQACQIGTFRSNGEHKKCIACPPGTTTEGERSIRREQCNTPRCKAGQFLVRETKNCQFCPRGTFQNEEQETVCKLCPPDHTTAAQGATAESQCYSTNQCATGEYNCSWHANCIDLPDENDVPSYECRCKPGYRGNGTHCTDACNDYCLNDGICKKNNLGNVECVCKEYFSGDRCELRFQPKTAKMSLIAMAIGGVVVILIVIVVIVFMISFRFNQVQDQPEKNGSTFADLSPTSNNILYGSPPAVCEPTTMPRTFGYYYEDDDVYETKMITERRPTTSTVASMGGAGGASSMTRAIEQHKYEQRMRQAQQHMYHPSNNNTDD